MCACSKSQTQGTSFCSVIPCASAHFPKVIQSSACLLHCSAPFIHLTPFFLTVVRHADDPPNATNSWEGSKKAGSVLELCFEGLAFFFTEHKTVISLSKTSFSSDIFRKTLQKALCPKEKDTQIGQTQGVGGPGQFQHSGSHTF